jgi:hypothetical protein
LGRYETNFIFKLLFKFNLTYYFSGTDADIYVQLNGDADNSRIFQIKPKRRQLEANSIDEFELDNIESKKLGELKSITITKQDTYAFFSDWNLVKVDLYDEKGKKYTFNCDCWLTRTRYKKTIELSLIEDNSVDANGDQHSNSRKSRTFSMPFTFIILFLIVLIALYIVNYAYELWKKNSFSMFI